MAATSTEGTARKLVTRKCVACGGRDKSQQNLARGKYTTHGPDMGLARPMLRRVHTETNSVRSQRAATFK